VEPHPKKIQFNNFVVATEKEKKWRKKYIVIKRGGKEGPSYFCAAAMKF